MVIHDDRARRSLGDQGARRQVHHALVGRVEVVRTASIVVCIVRPQYLLSTSSGYHCQPVTFFLALESSLIVCQKRALWTLFALQCSALRRRCGRRGGKLVEDIWVEVAELLRRVLVVPLVPGFPS